MNDRRYHSYRRAVGLIDEISERRVEPEATAALRQCAEDLLLSREASVETEELGEQAAVAVTRLTAAGAISSDLATVVCRAVYSSGPPSANGLRERANEPFSWLA
jgi:hypothetical protein